jgi:hypothetical protein
MNPNGLLDAVRVFDAANQRASRVNVERRSRVSRETGGPA